jgi:hypothetical protein
MEYAQFPDIKTLEVGVNMLVPVGVGLKLYAHVSNHALMKIKRCKKKADNIYGWSTGEHTNELIPGITFCKIDGVYFL